MKSTINGVILVGTTSEAVRNLPDDALVPLPIACALTGRRKSSLYEGVRRGEVPAPVVRQPRFTRWRLGDLLEHVRGRAAAGKHTQVAAVSPEHPAHAATAAQRLLASVAASPVRDGASS